MKANVATKAGTVDRLWRCGVAAALLLTALLQGTAAARQSLVGDAPYHLLAGHQALRYGENRLNLEHPPLVKLLVALPLLAEQPLAPPITVEQVLETSLNVFDDPQRLHRVRIAARLIALVAFAAPFLVACFFLGRRVGGRRTGVLLVLVIGLSIPTLPILSILQTDTAVALGFTLSVLAALAYVEAPSAARAGVLGLGMGLAAAAKFSGVLVLPTAVLAFVLARGRGGRWVGHAAMTGAVALVVVWTSYGVANRRYDPEAGRDTIARYCRNEALVVDDRMRPYEEPLLAIERVSPSLAQWLTGFVGIRIQNAIGVYPSYAFGDLSTQGRWWYFPAVLLVKTPLVVLAMTWAALVAWTRGRAGKPRPGFEDGVRCQPAGRAAFRTPPAEPWTGLAHPASLLFVVTSVVYLGVAMTSNYNLGVRHLLPILPLLYLPAALWAARRRWRSALLVGVLAVEAVALTPYWMSATNTWWLGRHNPARFAFSIGDAEYRQNFLALARVAEKRGLSPLHVVYPLVSEKEIRAYLPDAKAAGPGIELRSGAWYAVSTTLEQFLPAIRRTRPEEVRGHASLVRLAEAWQPYWQELVERGEEHDYVAATFHLYLLP